MDRLTAKVVCPPFEPVTIESSPPSKDWQARFPFKGPDARYLWDYAVLSRGDMIQMAEAIASAIEAARDESNFNAVAIRKRYLKQSCPLTMEAQFHPDKSLKIIVWPGYSPSGNAVTITNAQESIKHIIHVIAVGDQVVA